MKHKPSHLFVVCWASLAVACGAGDNRLDPADLELRDLLGIAPETAMMWDGDQRDAARRVIDEAMRHGELAEHRAALAKDERLELDRRVARAIAEVDAQRAGHGAAAVGVAHVAVGAHEVIAQMRASALEPVAATEVVLDGWLGKPWGFLAERNRGVLGKLAADAGHAGGPVAVAPVPRLAAGAVYLASPSPRLLVNPVVLAALEPQTEPVVEPVVETARTASAASATRSAPKGKLGSIVLFPSAPATSPTTPGGKPSTAAAVNPYSFYRSIGECAADQRARCVSCAQSNTCVPVTDLTDGNAECAQLGANGERGFSLVCINLALAIDMVSACTQDRAPSCAQDVRAGNAFGSLENNARFFDEATCGQPLDACLAQVFGSTPDPTPPPPVDPAPGCAADGCDSDPGCDEACNGDVTCEGDSCDGDGSSGDCGGEGGGCDGEDACGGSDNSACSDSDCGGEGGGCDGGGESCDGGGGGCEGGGGDCGGGGGDCGGGDCSTTKRKHRSQGTLMAVAWALLPLPFALFFRRRRRKPGPGHTPPPAPVPSNDNVVADAPGSEEDRSDDLADFERRDRADGIAGDTREDDNNESSAKREDDNNEVSA